MIGAIDAEKAFHKIQYPFMKKNTQTIETEGYFKQIRNLNIKCSNIVKYYAYFSLIVVSV